MARCGFDSSTSPQAQLLYITIEDALFNYNLSSLTVDLHDVKTSSKLNRSGVLANERATYGVNLDRVSLAKNIDCAFASYNYSLGSLNVSYA